MTYNRFDVAITLFPFSESRGQKIRPVVLLTDNAFHAQTGEAIAAMVTSADFTRWPSDIQIYDLESAGLRKPCIMRMKIFTLAIDRIAGKIGSLSESDRRSAAAGIAVTLLP